MRRTLSPHAALAAWGLALGALAAGYALLWRGVTGPAALVLVVAYVVAVPVAILVRRAPDANIGRR